MSVPPPGGWQPPQQPGPPPPGWQPGPWQQQPGPPPNRGNGLKWLLIAVAVLLVVAVSIGGTLLFTRDGGGGGGTTTTSSAPSDFASANDTGPVKVITDEPTCKIFSGINSTLVAVQDNGWPEARGTLGPVSEWTPEQHSQIQGVAAAVASAADQMVPLAKKTPSRVVRELYEQFIAYGRAYSNSLSNYTPTDDNLASVFVNASSAVVGICNSIETGSASRSLTLPPASPPIGVTSPRDSAPQRFVETANPACSEWTQRSQKFSSEVGTAWQDRDTSIPASRWTPEQRTAAAVAYPLLKAYADDIETAGQQGGNPVLEDFATASALYIRAFLVAGDAYTEADGWLYFTAFRFANVVTAACRAVAG